MKMLNRLFTAALSLLTLFACNPATEEAKSIPPTADKVATKLSGDRVDNYYWMKLSDEQKNSEQKDEQTQKVLKYLTDENDYLTAQMKHTEALQEKIYNEIVGRIKQTDESVPYKDNGYGTTIVTNKVKSIRFIAGKKERWMQLRKYFSM